MDPELSGLDQVASALARRWLLVLLVAVPLFGATLGVAATLPTTWTATSTVAFSPRAENPVGADTLAIVLPSYVSYVLSPAVLEDVGRDAGVDDVRDAVEVSIPPTTATLEVEATARTAQQAADVAGGLATAAAERGARDPAVDAEVVAAAVPPVDPSGPPRRILALAGLFTAVLTGLLAAAAVEAGVARLRTAADVRGAVGREVLCRLPLSRAVRALPGDGLTDPAVGLALRTLRSGLDLGSMPGRARVLAVCSPSRGDGRSTVAALLATSLARDGFRVLVVDGDLVDRRLSRELTDSTEEGLLEALDGAPLESAVQPTALGGVSLLSLPEGSNEHLPELLARRAAPLMSHVREPRGLTSGATSEGAPAAQEHPQHDGAAYDVLLVDTPPVLERDEAVLLAALADDVLLVADSGGRARPLREAGAALEAAGARPVGVVLNRVSRRSVLSSP